MNYIDYIKHTLYLPGTYHRRYDLDLPKIQENVQRIALVLLPFVGLYRPVGKTLSIVMNGSRTVAHLQNAFIAEEKREWASCAVEVGKVGVATLSLATTMVHFTSGLFLITGYDTLQSATSSLQALREGEYSKALEESLQTLASAFYLGFMATGSLEVMLVFILLQTTVCLYQARADFAKGRYLEGSAKLAMAAIRMNQAKQCLSQIQKRNAYLEIQRIRTVFQKLMRGRQASHLIHHPLSSLKERIESKEVMLADANGREHGFGSHFHGEGGKLVKGENLIFRTKFIDGKEVVELDFKINHAFREKLNESIKELQSIKAKELREVLFLTGSHIEDISVQSGSLFSDRNKPDNFFDIGKAHQIKVGSLGNILIGSEAGQPNLYDRVVVQIDSNQTLFGLHEMLSLIDLDQAICLSTKEDIERLKMGHLFRTFFPRDATPFERTEEFFSLPLDQLKEKMIEKSPEMKTIFENYLHRMKEESLFDGRIRYRIEGLAEAAYDLGARALTAAITGAYTDQELFGRIASMLKMGMLSTEVRDENGFAKHGLGGFGFDYLSGGADSIFTQMFTEKNCREQMNVERLAYYSKVRLLISLDALEMGTYQYHDDNFGTRLVQENASPLWGEWEGFMSNYENRDSILEFIQKEQARFHGHHEIMLKERLNPSFFKGLIVPDEKTKQSLIEYLSQNDLIQQGSILNIPVDRFIRVGTKVTEELIS